MEQLIWGSLYCLEVRGKLHQVLIFLWQQINNSRLQLRKQRMQVLSAPNSKSILANGVNRKSFDLTTSSKKIKVLLLKCTPDLITWPAATNTPHRFAKSLVVSKQKSN